MYISYVCTRGTLAYLFSLPPDTSLSYRSSRVSIFWLDCTCLRSRRFSREEPTKKPERNHLVSLRSIVPLIYIYTSYYQITVSTRMFVHRSWSIACAKKGRGKKGMRDGKERGKIYNREFGFRREKVNEKVINSVASMRIETESNCAYLMSRALDDRY